MPWGERGSTQDEANTSNNSAHVSDIKAPRLERRKWWEWRKSQRDTATTIFSWASTELYCANNNLFSFSPSISCSLPLFSSPIPIPFSAISFSPSLPWSPPLPFDPFTVSLSLSPSLSLHLLLLCFFFLFSFLLNAISVCAFAISYLAIRYVAFAVWFVWVYVICH